MRPSFVGSLAVSSSAPAKWWKQKISSCIQQDAIEKRQPSGVPHPAAGHRGLQVSIRIAAAMPRREHPPKAASDKRAGASGHARGHVLGPPSRPTDCPCVARQRALWRCAAGAAGAGRQQPSAAALLVWKSSRKCCKALSKPFRKSGTYYMWWRPLDMHVTRPRE